MGRNILEGAHGCVTRAGDYGMEKPNRGIVATAGTNGSYVFKVLVKKVAKDLDLQFCRKIYEAHCTPKR